MLIAGTCIGGGTIALPIVLSKLGIVPSIFFTLLVWASMYYASLVSLELNLQAGSGLDLGRLSRRFSGRIAEVIGAGSIKILSYALVAVYISGGSSIFQKLIGDTFSLDAVALSYSLIIILLLSCPVYVVDNINRILFVGLICLFCPLMAGLLSIINWGNLPLFAENYTDMSIWRSLVPVVFTSFGFQVIFHTLTEYCNKNSAMLKKVFLYGSAIPTIVYILWTCAVLGALHNGNAGFYEQMIHGNIDVGTLIQELSRITHWQSIQSLIWWVSLLAIITSILGVGLGLCDSLKQTIKTRIKNDQLSSLTAATLTIAPGYLVAVFIPNTFIAVLGFAGMILAIIAILLPMYLLYKANIKKFYYKELQYRLLRTLAILMGLIIIACEVSLW